MTPPEPKTLHRAIITIGSNYEAEHNVPYVLSRLGASLSIVAQTQPMLTEPIDFPYDSCQFVNVVLLATTTESLAQVNKALKHLEEACGRTPARRKAHPEQVPMDIDLIIWDDEVCKPRDLQRPYVIEGLTQLSIPIPTT